MDSTESFPNVKPTMYAIVLMWALTFLSVFSIQEDDVFEWCVLMILLLMISVLGSSFMISYGYGLEFIREGRYNLILEESPALNRIMLGRINGNCDKGFLASRLVLAKFLVCAVLLRGMVAVLATMTFVCGFTTMVLSLFVATAACLDYIYSHRLQNRSYPDHACGL